MNIFSIASMSCGFSQTDSVSIKKYKKIMVKMFWYGKVVKRLMGYFQTAMSASTLFCLMS